MLKVKNVPFIGGDTQTFEFDFGTKVAGSVAECPLNIYWSYTNSLKTPNDINNDALTGFHKNDVQSAFDPMKTLDGQCSMYKSSDLTSSSGIISQLMVELDLTPLCNSLFGGSNSAMKAAIKSFQLDTWGKGSGANGGVLANNFVWQVWWNGNNPMWGASNWPNWYGGHTSPSIAESKSPWMSQSDCVYLVNSSNKIYVLLSTYPSDGTIPSEVDLDYINIKLQFARVPDVVAHIPITLPQTWSMLIKGFSPAWNTSDFSSGYIKYLLKLANSADNASYDLSYQGGKFVLTSWNGSFANNAWSDTISLTKFKTVNLLVEQTSTGLRMRVLVNNSVVLKYFLSTTDTFPGDKQLAILMHVSNQYQGDAFLNSLIFLPNKNFDDDTEAEGLLRGTTTGYEEDELFDITRLPVNAKNIVDLTQGTLTINADAQWEGTGISISVLPNNKYHFHCATNNLNLAFVRIDELYNAIPTNPNVGNRGTDFDIITGSKTNNIFLLLTNSGPGEVTYSNISFKLKM